METKAKEIKALRAYKEVALKEYEESQARHDGLDTKIGLFSALGIAVPSLLLSSIKIQPGIAGRTAIGFYGFGLLILAIICYQLFQALKIRMMSFGVPYVQFTNDCKAYDDDTIEESLAEMRMVAAEENVKTVMEKASHLKSLQWLLLLEIAAFLIGGLVALAGGL